MSGQHEGLLAQLEAAYDAKVLRTELTARQALATAASSDLASALSAVETQLRLLEDGHALNPALNQTFDRKILATTLIARITAEDSQFETLESTVNAMEVLLRSVENDFLNFLTKQANA